ncbi:MAG: isochorismatase [Acidobacteria bacterium]|nr:isochorismatase [Acidobacteriota bacterium]
MDLNPDQLLPIPPHFDEAKADRIWGVPYQQRAGEAEAWAAAHGIPPASADTERVCLFVIDLQVTFCIPGWELFVAGRSGRGAVEDNVRLCRFIYRHLHRITEIVATLDTHTALQIFHPAFLVDREGKHPGPVTPIPRDALEAGEWKVDPDVARSLGLGTPEELDAHLLHYGRQLSRGGKYTHMVWPYHAMLGGVGHALAPVVEEALFFHALARKSQTRFEIKGQHPLTEHYSVLGAEVDRRSDGSPLGAKNAALVEHLLGFDTVVIAGQAKSHCVAWTVQDLLDEIGARKPGFERQVRLLKDCCSPVVVPGVADFTDLAAAAFRGFRKAGVRVVTSEDPWGA